MKSCNVDERVLKISDEKSLHLKASDWQVLADRELPPVETGGAD